MSLTMKKRDRDARTADVQESKSARAVPDAVLPPLAAACFAQSLKSLAFFLGGTHVAGWVEEAERAAREGKVVRYE